MIKNLLALIARAGFRQTKQIALLGFTLATALAGIVQEWLSVSGLSFAVALGLLAIEYEVLLARASKRAKAIIESWPIVIESLESAAVAGMSLLESLRDIAESEQLIVAGEFAECCAAIDAGVGIQDALGQLKVNLAVAPADFTIELLRVVQDYGSGGYLNSLRVQADALRDQAGLEAELAAKQGWVVGTAKLAVGAPWLIVAMLSFRPENAAIYSSAAGTALLLFGLLASAIALRMVYRIGASQGAERVFE